MSSFNITQSVHKAQSISTKPSALFKRASFAASTFNDDFDDYKTVKIFTSASKTSQTARSIKSLTSKSSYYNDDPNENTCCSCRRKVKQPKLDPKLLEEKLQKREEELREEFEETLGREIGYLKERFDFILQNEQARASCMLREAHRERKEKIAALQQQLECKNMAGLMYVMCAERTKCKVEKMQIVETFTRYINILNNILADGQELILNLSRGYKTAARVDYEWKEKMKKVICEFKSFIGNFTGCPPDQNQYLIDLPKLLEVEAPTEDDPIEDPIEEDPPEPVNPEDLDANKEWWQLLDEDNRPFAVYGDIGDFKPPQRREALKRIKAAKTAPRKWQQYMFHDMFLNSNCPNAERMKREYFNRIPDSPQFDCNISPTWDNKFASRRQTAQSIDIRGNMGSILKIITTTGLAEPMPKTNLLAARDSMEIVSTTRMRDKSKSQDWSAMPPGATPNKGIDFKIGQRRASFYEADEAIEEVGETPERGPRDSVYPKRKNDEEEPNAFGLGPLCKEHTDSLEVIAKHTPDRDHAINYEKICPVKTCQRKHVDSFMNALPRYMHASPFTHFEETFEHYQTCTPEQLIMLKERIDEKKKKEKQSQREEMEFDPLLEWKDSVQGVGIQTSELSYLNVDLPPCTCRDPVPTPDSGPGAAYRLEDLLPLKRNLDQITKECLFDDQIEFQRFRVIGQEESRESIQAKTQLNQIKQNFTRDRLREIQKILKQHPSLLDLFQANTRC